MNIGIIGAGPIGTNLAKKFREAGHVVKIANSRGPDTLKSVTMETGATAATCREAVMDVDVVILSIPLKNVGQLPKGLFSEVADDVVIIDTTNYYPERDGRIEAIDEGKIESGYVSDLIGHPVIKAFNTMLSQVLGAAGKPTGARERIALPVAGDDAKAKEIAIKLVDTAGFDGIDGGTLEDSWRQQPGTPVYCTDHDAEGVRRGLLRANRERAPKNRDTVWTEFTRIPVGTEPDAFAGLVRTISRATNN